MQKAAAIPEKMFDNRVDETLGLGKRRTGPSSNVDRKSAKDKSCNRVLEFTSARAADIIGFLDTMVASDGVDICPKTGEKYFVKESWKSIHAK